MLYRQRITAFSLYDFATVNSLRSSGRFCGFGLLFIIMCSWRTVICLNEVSCCFETNSAVTYVFAR